MKHQRIGIYNMDGITYILIGVVWALFIEWQYHRAHDDNTPIKRLTNQVRLMCVLIWPVAMGIFFYFFFLEKNK